MHFVFIQVVFFWLLKFDDLNHVSMKGAKTKQIWKKANILQAQYFK